MKALFVGVGSIGTRHIIDFYNACVSEGIYPEITVLRRNITVLSDAINDIVKRQIMKVSDDDFFDVIFITNPTNLHYSAMEDVKNHGGYFFIEKPIFDAMDYDYKKLGINSRNTYVAAPMRHTKIYNELYSIAHKNKVFSARIICSSYLPEWRPNVDYRENYSAKKEMGGGVCLDLVHEIDYMVGLFGIPKNSHCFHGKYSDLEITSDDLSVYIMEYEDKLCEIHLDYFGRKYRRSCELFTSEGTYTADFLNEIIETPKGEIIDCKGEIDSEFKNEMEYFVRFINGSGEEINPPELALESLRITLGD